MMMNLSYLKDSSLPDQPLWQVFPRQLSSRLKFLVPVPGLTRDVFFIAKT